MVEVQVVGIALDATGQHVILLAPDHPSDFAGQLLPIWIGQEEATSILVAIGQAPLPRPFSHDLMRSMVEALGAEVVSVSVTGIEEGTYFATVTLLGPEGEVVIDARPSDAVALASRTGSPILVADAVFEEAGVPDTITGADDPDPDGSEGSEGDQPVDAAEAESRVEQFREFLDSVDPEDFKN